MDGQEGGSTHSSEGNKTRAVLLWSRTAQVGRLVGEEGRVTKVWNKNRIRRHDRQKQA